jgi:thiol-disulfide isomerase/thioredoxin
VKLFNLSVALAAFALSAISTAGLAAPIQRFSNAALEAAQRAGKPVLVDVHADWCPTCRRQAPTVEAISRDPAFAKLLILKLDFDAQVAERTALGVRKQSTLIAYNGRTERTRATGIIDPVQIRALAATALR